jgi:hypothetical protein
MWSKKSRNWGLGIVLIIIVAVVGIVWWQYTHTDDYLLQKYYEDLERQYMEDTIGGATPEETLSMFISALKTGDVDLASKYFILEDQEEWRENLLDIKEGGAVDVMVRDLSTAKRGKDLGDDSTIFSVVNPLNEVVAMINIVRLPNGIWKILDL